MGNPTIVSMAKASKPDPSVNTVQASASGSPAIVGMMPNKVASGNGSKPKK